VEEEEEASCCLMAHAQWTASMLATAFQLCAQCISVSKHKCRLTSMHSEHNEHYLVTRCLVFNCATCTKSRVIVVVESVNKSSEKIFKLGCRLCN
jgi:hypothetical protein